MTAPFAGAAETPEGLKNPMAAAASIAIMVARIFASSFMLLPTELVALRSFGKWPQTGKARTMSTKCESALTRRTRGRSLAQITEELARYLTGWRAYFGFCMAVHGAIGGVTSDCGGVKRGGVVRREGRTVVDSGLRCGRHHQPSSAHDARDNPLTRASSLLGSRRSRSEPMDRRGL